MTTTLDVVSPKNHENDGRPAEPAAAAEPVRLAKEHRLALTGPDGLLKMFTKNVLETAQALKWRVIQSCVVVGAIALMTTGCQYVFPSDPGPPGPLGISTDGETIFATLPQCAPQPRSAEMSIDEDGPVWQATNVTAHDLARIPLRGGVWRKSSSSVPPTPAELRDATVVVIDRDYRQWIVSGVDGTAIPDVKTSNVLTDEGITTISKLRSASCG